MFLRRRSCQPESFDALDRPAAEVEQDYAQLGRVNRVFFHADPFTRLVQRAPLPHRWRQVEVLELGAGTGGLARELAAWARRRHWDWQFTCLDQNPAGLARNPAPRKIVADARCLPFADASFDLVIASQMTHHLDDQGVIRHFREAWRVTRGALILSDLHRNVFLLGLVSAVLPLLGTSRRLRADGRLSVRRGFRVDEWRAAAAAAGIPNPRVAVQFGCRIVLWADRARHAIPTGAPESR